MGVNDDREMLEVAREECASLERQLAEAQAEVATLRAQSVEPRTAHVVTHARGNGKTNALVESLLQLAEDRGLRVEIVEPTQQPDEIRAELARALFEWNTPSDPFFVIGGRLVPRGKEADATDPYDVIADAILASFDVRPKVIGR